MTQRLEDVARAATPSPADGASLGWALLANGLTDEADKVFRVLARQYPRLPAALVGRARVAMNRALWHEAYLRWDQAFERFGRSADWAWREGQGSVLFNLGRLGEAETAFRQVVETAPLRPDGYVGLALVAMRSERWQTALEHWDAALADADGSIATDWRLGRARSLLKLNRPDEAEAACREISAVAPCSRDGASQLSPGLERRAQAQLLHLQAHILIRRRRLAEARALCAKSLSGAGDLFVLGVLFDLVGVLQERPERERYWTALLNRLESLPHDAVGADGESPVSLRLRILLALRDHSEFLTEFSRLGSLRPLGEQGPGLAAVAARLRDPEFPNRGKLRIFGIGLSRTGTMTLTSALTELGFNAAHFVNPLTSDLLEEDDFDLYDAATDTPVCGQFEALYERYPAAKFVYTVRSLADWERSVKSLFSRSLGCGEFADFRALLEDDDAFLYGQRISRTYRSIYSGCHSFEEAYRSYDRRVRQFFRDKPPDRFLELNICGGEGWSALANFLGLPVPQTEFPWRNSSRL